VAQRLGRGICNLDNLSREEKQQGQLQTRFLVRA
jgi:hypothetical protein